MRVRMTARSIDEPDRVASQLELLFDLTFVVAIASATEQLARSVAGGDAVDGLLSFLQVFFAVWWAWMNFTWFASSYDTDDVAYRLLTLMQNDPQLFGGATGIHASTIVDQINLQLTNFDHQYGLNPDAAKATNDNFLDITDIVAGDPNLANVPAGGSIWTFKIFEEYSGPQRAASAN